MSLFAFLNLSAQLENIGIISSFTHLDPNFSSDKEKNLKFGADVNFKLSGNFFCGTGLRFQRFEIEDLTYWSSPLTLSDNTSLISLADITNQFQPQKENTKIELPLRIYYELASNKLYSNLGLGINYEINSDELTSNSTNIFFQVELGYKIGNQFLLGVLFNKYHKLNSTLWTRQYNQLLSIDLSLKYKFPVRIN